jgi:hypothetical protein
VFEQRLRAAFPLAADKVLARVRDVRGGRLNDPAFGSRMRGEGEYADAIHRLFDTTARRYGLAREPRDEMRAPREPRPEERAEAETETKPPVPQRRQLSLFRG